jgi:quercetin dioxygenase-like cupin family protein
MGNMYRAMKTPSLKSGGLDEYHCADDDSIRHRSSWPTWKGEGSTGAVCYFEIPSGCHLGPHVHDTEEIVLIIEGEGEARLGKESSAISQGELVVMPKDQRHDLVNKGDDDLKAVGYFPASSVTTIFEVELEPAGTKKLGTPNRADD